MPRRWGKVGGTANSPVSREEDEVLEKSAKEDLEGVQAEQFVFIAISQVGFRVALCKCS